MLTEAIVVKSKYLDRYILKESKPPCDEIRKLLDSILYTTQNYEFNYSKFETLYVLFRKWYTLINIYYPNSYSKSLDKSSYFFCNIERYNFKEISHLLLKHSDEYIKHKNFDLLINFIDPYSHSNSNHIKKIDKDFYTKYITIEILNDAAKQFKDCNLDNAQKLNFKALDSLSNLDQLDNLHLYFYSWAFHNLGNIELVKSNYRIASFYYNDSLRLKNQIDILPPLLNYTTKVKHFTTSMYLLKPEDYYTDMQSFYIELENNFDLCKNNRLWYKNILVDTSYNMAKISFYKGDIESAKKYINVSIKNGIEVEDKLGLIKAFILKLFFSKSIKYDLAHLELQIQSLSTKNKQNPYLAFLLCDNNLNEWGLINNKIKNRVLNLFEKNSIIKETLPLNKYLVADKEVVPANKILSFKPYK